MRFASNVEPAFNNDRDCMSDRIKRAIIARICDGTYAPGERLVELQIAREFNTSQAPVREALCALATMNIVETQPYKGTRVRQISQQELEDCLRIRACLESLAAEMAGDRLLKNIDVLKEKAQATMEAARERCPRKYALSNLEFHRLIVQSSASATLINVWEMLSPEIRMLANVRDHADNLLEAAHDHMEIAEAFADGENRYAGKLLKRHAETVLAHSLKHEPT